jgi:hypothetical protein
MLAQYGSVNSMSQRKVYEWVARFKSGRISVTKLDRGTRHRYAPKATPIMLTLIREHRRITVSEVADMLDFSSGSAYVTVVSISLCLWLVQELPLLFEYLRTRHHIPEDLDFYTVTGNSKPMYNTFIT